MNYRTLSDCVICDDVGCEFCRQVVEPWPQETFAALGDVDLAQLIEDAVSELARRAVCGANRKNSNGPERFDLDGLSAFRAEGRTVPMIEDRHEFSDDPFLRSIDAAALALTVTPLKPGGHIKALTAPCDRSGLNSEQTAFEQHDVQMRLK